MLLPRLHRRSPAHRGCGSLRATRDLRASGAGTARARVAQRRGGRVKASPATRRKAREAGIDLRQVPGSGPSGRIMPKDFDAAVSGAAPASKNGGGRQPRRRCCGPHRQRRGQGHRRAARDRATHDRRRAHDPAFLVRRGSRRHRTRVAAHASQFEGAQGHARAHVPAVPRRCARARARGVSPVQRALRRRAQRADPAPSGAPGRGDADARRPQGARRATRRSPHALGPVGRDPPRVRGRQEQQGLARGTERLDDHDHQPRPHGRHRLDADHQRARDGHHRRQQGDRPARRPRRRRRHPPHHESVVVVRSPLRRRLRRRRDDPGAQGPARAPGDDLHPRLNWQPSKRRPVPENKP